MYIKIKSTSHIFTVFQAVIILRHLATELLSATGVRSLNQDLSSSGYQEVEKRALSPELGVRTLHSWRASSAPKKEKEKEKKDTKGIKKKIQKKKIKMEQPKKLDNQRIIREAVDQIVQNHLSLNLNEAEKYVHPKLTSAVSKKKKKNF